MAAAVARGAGVDEAFRIATVVGDVCCEANCAGRCCCSLIDRVYVENEVAHGANIDGGYLFAKALAGQSALLASIF